ncbi:helix-turn-helix domain-containing protein [Streptomyces sp. JV190]|uniref:helix-turn-helix domain-containing protein n=1 Tax=Streptomyces sp. JV190 TaxID=3002533 RepID=UPI003FA73CF5
MWWPCGWEAYQPSPSIAGPSLSRPQLAEARRVRAAELFEDGVSNAEIARAVGVCAESVRRWRRMWEQAVLRPCGDGQPPDGRPSWTTYRSRRSGLRWSKVPGLMVSRPTCGPWNESARSSPGQRGWCCRGRRCGGC